MLVLGRLDYVAGNLVTDEYRLKDIRNGNRVEALRPALAIRPFYLAISRKFQEGEEFIRKFNAGMKAYKANGNYQGFYKSIRLLVADEIIHFSFLASNFC